ncbi:MAG TPA: sugar ABC transporter permease [Candidatus Binatia bacterium]|nr:sugar ABC transporter permease [Candidatus Binatia bacterium]
MNPAPSHRLRFGIGLALGLLLAIGLGVLLLAGARQAEVRLRAEREAIVTLNALTGVVDRAGISGEAVRSAVASWTKAHPSVTAVRVIVLEGISLEASTDSSDRGDRAAPRRLAREEKPVYDRAQRLRAAVETNRQEGIPRKDEIEVERLKGGAFALAGPLERDGEVVGMAEIRTAPPPPAPAVPVGRALLYLLVPLAAYTAVALLLRERRSALAVAAFALLAVSLFLFARQTLATFESDRLATDRTVAARIGEEARLAPAILGVSAAPLEASKWDTDVFRRPRGAAPGTPPGGAERRGRNFFFGVAFGAMALTAFFGFGLAARLGGVLVRHHVAYFYILPSMLAMIVLVIFPFLYGVAISFTDQTIYNTGEPLTKLWVGVENYVHILSDFAITTRAPDGSRVFNYQNFYWTLGLTIVWTVTNVAIGVSVGLFLALILNTAGLRLRPIYRVLLILPWAVPNYITALIWKGMFHRQFGVINQMIQIFGGRPISWFDTPFTSFLTILSTNGWLSFPFMMVISLGALQSIPGEIYEAARVEGASRWQQFRAITLPSLKPSLIPAIIISVVWTFNMFNIPFLVSEGEPAHSTEILITQAYKFAFQQYRYGYAAAYCVIIFLILFAYGTVQNRVTRATEGI